METEKLSAEKMYLLSLPDQELRTLITLAEKAAAAELGKGGNGGGCPKIPSSVVKQLEEAKAMLKIRPTSVDADQRKWIYTCETVRELQMEIPAFYLSTTEREMYLKLKGACADNLLPEEFAGAMIPCVMEYVRRRKMKPIILAGPPGCGKTTAARILADVMGIPGQLICVPQAACGHGLSGDALSFRGADMGDIVRAMVRSKTLNPLLIIDEVDKDTNSTNRASITDELLSLCDNSAIAFFDNFLGFSLDVSHCPIVMTCNDLDLVPEPLKDRCRVFKFPEVALTRMYEIIGRYCDKKIDTTYAGHIRLDSKVLEAACERLYGRNVRSIRKHQEMVDSVLGRAYTISLETDAPVEADADMFTQEIGVVAGCAKKIGFR